MANADLPMSPEEINRHNASSLLAQASLNNFTAIFKKFDMQSFTRLRRFCKFVHQLCQKAEPLHTVKVKRLDVKGNSIKLKLENRRKIHLALLLRTNFKIHVVYFWFHICCNDDYLEDVADLLSNKRITIEHLNLYDVWATIANLNNFVEKFGIPAISIFARCPIEYLSNQINPIMTKVQNLELDDPISCPPNFLRLYNFDEACLVFAQEIPLSFFRSILEEVLTGRRTLKCWVLGPFDLSNVERLFHDWKIVNEEEEDSIENRPLVVRYTDELDLTSYRVVPVAGDTYYVKVRDHRLFLKSKVCEEFVKWAILNQECLKFLKNAMSPVMCSS